jgi:transposase
MQGLLLHAIVHSAGVQDRDGGIWLMATLFGQFPFLAKLFADSAYGGSIFHTALAKVLPNLKTEIVRRSDRAKGFVPLPRRWIVERTIAWLNRCRRLAKDWENLNRNALASRSAVAPTIEGGANIALAAPPLPDFPRLRALALFGRRLPECVVGSSLPASENLHTC